MAQILRVLWRRKLLVLITFVVVVAGGVLATALQAQRYDASVLLGLVPDMDEPASLPLYTTTVDAVLPAYYPVLQSREFLDGVAAELGDGLTGADLAGSVWVIPEGSPAVFRIAARSTDPEAAAEIARVTASAFIDVFSEEQAGIAQLRVVDDARPPTEPTTPRTTLIVPAVILAALLLAGGVGLLWDRLFGRVGDSATLRDVTGAKVLGRMPAAPELGEKRRLVVTGGEAVVPPFERSLRTLRTNLMFALEGRPEGPIVITSLKAGEGKSTVVANLAAATASLAYKVLLIDADFHRPVLHEYFDVDQSRGLTAAGTEGTALGDLMQKVADDALYLLPRGHGGSSRPNEVATYFHALPRSAELADFVFVDTAPLSAGDEARLLSASAAGVILVVRAGSCGAHELRSAVDSLRNLGVNLLGTVLTHATEKTDIGAAYEYAYPAEIQNLERVPFPGGSSKPPGAGGG